MPFPAALHPHHMGNIEPNPLGRANRYTWALLQEIDGLVK
jgi:hypothetical protein